ncbi:MAG TPA: rhomboid family intramembrane serine protease [Desulfobacteraceae bacterium]|nr:rhomboid family intramembrane serine protease [Desulfobacteraceae bacterium]
MFLPVGDIPNPKSTPYVNYALIGLNVAVFVLITLPLSAARPDIQNPLLIEYLRIFGGGGQWPVQAIYERISAYDLVVFQYGYRPADSSVATMFSAMFLHANWMHLAGNMLFLWIFGDNVEHRLGRTGYLLAYLAAGLAATLFFGLFVPDSQIPMIGASGAISGVLGFYFLWFPGNRVKVFIFLFPLIMTTVLVPARIVLGFYLLIDNLLPFLISTQAGGGVAHGAHIGGFIAGAALAFGIDRLPGMLRQRTQVSADRKGRGVQADAAAAMLSAINAGNLAEAAKLYPLLAGHRARSRIAVADLLSVGEFMLANGDPEGALTVFRRVISERPGDDQLDRAYLGAGKALLRKARCDTSAWHYFVAAVDLARTSALAEEARTYMRKIENCQE